MNKRNLTFVTGLELAFFDYISHFLMIQWIAIKKNVGTETRTYLQIEATRELVTSEDVDSAPEHPLSGVQSTEGHRKMRPNLHCSLTPTFHYSLINDHIYLFFLNKLIYLTQSSNYYLSLYISFLIKDVIHLIHLILIAIDISIIFLLYILIMNNTSPSSSIFILSFILL